MHETHGFTREAIVDSAFGATPCDHRLQFYETDEFLFQTTAGFLAEGLNAGHRLLVIATPPHRQGFLTALASRGFDHDDLCAAGRLTLADARETLGHFVVGGVPDEALFEAYCGDLVDRMLQLEPRVEVRAYGEMVDLLWRDGNPDAALRLEGFWGQMATRRSLSLLCGYGMENFRDESNGPKFQEVCRCHTHVVPAESYTLARDDDARAREISALQQRALALLTELEHSRALEASLQETRQELARLCGRLQEADQKKDEFLATLAHELRNPLAPIQNAVQILRTPRIVADGAQFATDVIDRQVRQMARLVDDLLELSRISTGTLDIKKGRIDVQELLRTAIETSRPVIERCGHELVVTVPPAIVYVDGDPARLAQVIANLLNNAAKYTNPGGRIALVADVCDCHVVISVHDTGIGIPSHMLDRVFDMFTQVEGARDRSLGGLGIGLTLSRQIIGMHDGTITADSGGMGKGSTFTVCLPLAGEGLDSKHDIPGDSLDHSASWGRRILVVDDNVDATESLAMFLAFHGNEIETAHDGAEAVQKADEFRPDVILLDIGLPVMNGHDAGRRIRKQPWARRTTLIALSGWGQDADREKSRAAGFNHHLVKPVDLTALGKLLARVEPSPRPGMDERHPSSKAVGGTPPVP